MTNCSCLSQAAAPCGEAPWQTILAESIRDPAELCRLLGLDAALAAEAEKAAAGWPLLVPRPYVARIRPGDPNDPLLLQILPRAAELATAPGYGPDPLGEAAAGCGPGLLRKYRGRILMLTTPECSVHCRFCFRRACRRPAAADGSEGDSPIFAGAKIGTVPGAKIGTVPLRQVAADRSVEEVILSGGDPLVLTDAELARLIGELAGGPKGTVPFSLARKSGQSPIIGHVRRVRIHTRMPITIPQRVTDGLIASLRTAGITTIVAVHINHPSEIDAAVASALGRLADAGIPLLSQSVLLRGVNDRAETLAELFGRLVDLRVMPYYLHHLDRVAGAAHFEAPISEGRALIAALRSRLPGYAVPRYVRETPGAASKEVLA